MSPWTVKKRWHEIYDRVAEVEPELLPPAIAEGPRAHSRGAERRRRLLNYLRQHPVELRPSPARLLGCDVLPIAFFFSSILASG